MKFLFDTQAIAQCIEEHLILVTCDAKIPSYEKYGLEYLQYELD